MAWNPTSWRFVTSLGFELAGGIAWQVGATGGSFFLKNSYTQRQIELKYGALGAGAGAGVPISLDFSARDMPSGALTPILARNRPRLEPDDFTGLFVMGNLQYAVIGHGMALSAVFFNLPLTDMLFQATGIGMGIGMVLDILRAGEGNMPSLVESARAVGLIYSKTVGFQAGVGAMYYYGYLSEAS
ncbi:MAG: hypothetical protein ACM3JH_12580 [Acidithiobacillales bacterium]